MAKKKEVIRIIDNNTFKFTIEEYEGECFDTKVEINGTFLCYISYSESEQFVNDLSEVIGRYRI